MRFASCSSHQLDRDLGNLSPNELLFSDDEGIIHIDAIESELNTVRCFTRVNLALQQ